MLLVLVEVADDVDKVCQRHIVKINAVFILHVFRKVVNVLLQHPSLIMLSFLQVLVKLFERAKDAVASQAFVVVVVDGAKTRSFLSRTASPT